MILKRGSKYHVMTEDGSKVLGTYATREEAVKRLQQVEYWKHKRPS